MTKLISCALALFIITAPAAAQTISLSRSSDCGGTTANCGTDGDRDTTWPGLQVDEGDTLRITLSHQGLTTEIVDTTTMFSGSAYTETDVGPDQVLVNVQCRVGRTALARSQTFISRHPSDAEIRAICEAAGSAYTRTSSITTIDRRLSYISSFSSRSSPRVWTFLIARDPDEGDETLSAVTSLDSFSIAAGVTLGTASVTVTIRGTDTAPSFGSETVSDQTFNKYGPITELQVPAATGGNGGPTTYTTTTLPTGLSFDADGSGDCPGDEAREICGTPTADAGDYTVTIIADDADCNPGANLDCSLASATTATADQARLSFTITIPRLPEISGNNTIDAADALLLFQHYSGLPVT